jgi:hypothetical protein
MFKMKHRSVVGRGTRSCGWAVILWIVASTDSASGQAVPGPAPVMSEMGQPEDTLQAGHRGLIGHGGMAGVAYGGCETGNCGQSGCGSCGSDGCGEGGCYSGRGDCVTAGYSRSRLGRIFGAYHDALCCPDPCYQPRWIDAANAAFFVDHARPVTMTRLRWDSGRNLIHPDRAEYFWAQIGGPGPANRETRVDYNELHLYQEVGVDKFSMFIDLPYRSFDSQRNGGHGGIGDLQIGTKSLLLDSDLLQFTFQFVTTIPTAGPGGGIGTGHVSLDPSILTTWKLHDNTYFQSQTGYWFGVGNSNGSILHYHNSINHVLWKPLSDTNLIGTLETVGYTFASGSFTDPVLGQRPANGTTYFSIGPGFRLATCGKLDLGIGMQFAVTDRHFAQRLYRTELRWRF